jgi:hypothetical protein
MITAIVTVCLTFLLTGVVGNLLLQGWQQRNWLTQQRFLGEQKNYENLKELSEEIVRLSNLRLWKMRRLLNAVQSGWPAPGSEDTKFGVTMGPEVGHGEAEVYAGVQT